MKVSLVLVSKNEENHIKKFFKSLKEQTRKPDEIVLVDSSSDRTAEIAKPSVDKLIKTPTKSAGHARKIGVENSKGEIIVFTDMDTILHPDWLKELVRPFENPEVNVVQGQIFFHSYNGKDEKGMFSAGLKDKGKYLNNCNAAFRRKVLEKNPLDPQQIWDDIDLGYRISKKYIIYGCKKSKVYHYESALKKRFRKKQDFWRLTFVLSVGWIRLFKKYKSFYWLLRSWYNIFGVLFVTDKKDVGFPIRFKIFFYYALTFLYAFFLEIIMGYSPSPQKR